ncbi:(2Fe-2S)-binding protein [Sandaracinus amylolyticus]|uniref:Sarcosine oxidase beta subunit n=1 Tax=Sandaracinus amylolyticus TaxID=927083 RepID=A0A0F6W0U6_9BACT|nr:(2Fe-2S)-binding protein [Sandaracinus amylolyticus]AKF04365.1 Sarcosine oxidase beta subunit [Sandaracinus amylolyticus]
MSDKILACRCEDVTTHEIEEAVRAGHRDLESLKRYTGFGTGWCQGKQCVALCARMLVELGGDPPDAPITPRPPFHPVSVARLARLLPEEDE